MDHPQVAKWQDLVSPGGLMPEAGGAEVRMKVSTLRPLGTIEPDGRESPNGRARVCASLDTLSRKGGDRQTAIRGAKRVGHRDTEGTERTDDRGQRAVDSGQTEKRGAPVESSDLLIQTSPDGRESPKRGLRNSDPVWGTSDPVWALRWRGTASCVGRPFGLEYALVSRVARRAIPGKEMNG